MQASKRVRYSLHRFENPLFRSTKLLSSVYAIYIYAWIYDAWIIQGRSKPNRVVCLRTPSRLVFCEELHTQKYVIYYSWVSRDVINRDIGSSKLHRNYFKFILFLEQRQLYIKIIINWPKNWNVFINWCRGK